MKRNNFRTLIIGSLIVITGALTIWINRKPVPLTRQVPIERIEEPKKAANPPASSPVREFLPSSYKGSSIQLDFVDEKGAPLHLEDIYVGPFLIVEAPAYNIRLRGQKV